MGKINQILSKSLIFILHQYQYLISPMLGPRCRFYPSCSNYSIAALTHFNLIKSSYLILRRISCCHPFHPGGYDPLLHTTKRAIAIPQNLIGSHLPTIPK